MTNDSLKEMEKRTNYLCNTLKPNAKMINLRYQTYVYWTIICKAGPEIWVSVDNLAKI